VTRCCILALDLGTSTGWAFRGHDGLITSGTSGSLRPGRFDGGGMRYLRFTNWLTEIDRLSGPIAAIWFEEVRRHAAPTRAHIYGGLMATLTAWAELRGVPYEGVPVGTIKRHATGKGNADKEAMIAAAGPRLQPRRRQRGRCHRHPALGHRDERGCRMRWHPRGYGGRAVIPIRSSATAGTNRACWPSPHRRPRLTWPERNWSASWARSSTARPYRPREVRHG
jgi:hypothetical protein